MNYFFYSLNTQFENTGDLLINKALINLLSSKGVVYIEDANKPQDFIDQLLDKNVVQLSTVSTKSNVIDYLDERLTDKKRKDSYFLILVPGDLSKVGIKMAIKSSLYALKRLIPLKKRGAKVLRLGVSLGNFDFFNGYVESFNSWIYFYYAVRDKKSLKIAENYNFSNLNYFPDLAWTYCWKDKPKIASKKKDYVVLSFRSNASGKYHDTAYIEKITKSLKDILLNSDLKDYKIYVSYQVEYDRSASEYIFNYFKDEFDIEFIDKNLNIEEAPDLYFNAKIVITNRLHVFMLALLTDTLAIPVIDKIDNKKIWNILEDNDLEGLVLDRQLPSEKNIERLNKIFNENEFWLKKFNEKKRENSEYISKKVDSLFL
ncbi:polysaccharide pyruvyl transferase family protein [Flavobacterium sp. W22_SRS_FK3]|uniref:polysaccharide pyruvyl transferase family protein n=1 Tax=Flavobacterium sp. W22_SRS_FK3 TaxID=3240275 RepID=UPI003F8F1EDA